MSGQRTRVWNARQVICAAVSMISYAALTTSLAAQQQDKATTPAREPRAQDSVSLRIFVAGRPKPQPRRRVAVRPAPAPPPAAPRPVVQGERGTGPVSGY